MVAIRQRAIVAGVAVAALTLLMVGLTQSPDTEVQRVLATTLSSVLQASPTDKASIFEVIVPTTTMLTSAMSPSPAEKAASLEVAMPNSTMTLSAVMQASSAERASSLETSVPNSSGFMATTLSSAKLPSPADKDSSLEASVSNSSGQNFPWKSICMGQACYTLPEDTIVRLTARLDAEPDIESPAGSIYKYPIFSTAPSSHMQNVSCPSTGLGWVERSEGVELKYWPKVRKQYAVCRIPEGSYFAEKFQHLVEVLYPCWSWFQMHPKAQHVMCDQYVSRRGLGALSNNLVKDGIKTNHAWIEGILDVFRRINVTFLKWPCTLSNKMVQQSTVSAFRIYKEIHQTARRAWFFEPKHAVSLAAHALQLAPNEAETFEATPRVALLDRVGKRGVRNLDEVLFHMRRHWQTTLGYMENKSFIEQIRWFHSQDVVVSPHGAQSTSLPFMPVCGAFLEFHTKYGEKLWDYGGMAADAGLTSAFLYLSTKTIKDDMANQARSYSFEKRALIVNRWIRDHRVCVPPSAVTDAVKELIGKRELCIKNAMSRKPHSAE